MSETMFSTGSVVLRLLGEYPKDALVVEGYDIQGNLVVHPLNGGFRYKINARQAIRLREVPVPDLGRRVFRRASFSLTNSNAVFAGWTDGQLCNGHATPYFERAEAERLMTHLNGRSLDAADAFVIRLDGIQEVWKAKTVHTVEGNKVKVYGIGAGVWSWRKVEAVASTHA